MKFLETHFEEYLQVSQKQNLHPKLEKIFNKFPNKLSDLKNLIFYGPSGVGKYTQMLKSIKRYSPSELKYEKKIGILFNKQTFFFKISDIHYEIEMSLLGCNSKLLWHDIFTQLTDIISAKNEKSGIIVCKGFHDIHNELLEHFYSYMQKTNNFIDIKFILISEEISFIPDNILNCCEIITLSRPSKTIYSKCIKMVPLNINVEDINNIKNLSTSIRELMNPHKIICNKIIHEMNNNEMVFLKFRDTLYDIFIYHLDVTDCVWYILCELIKQKKIEMDNLSNILLKTYKFFKYYNNNYRPIYHLENYFFYLIATIHGYKI